MVDSARQLHRKLSKLKVWKTKQRRCLMLWSKLAMDKAFIKKKITPSRSQMSFAVIISQLKTRLRFNNNLFNVIRSLRKELIPTPLVATHPHSSKQLKLTTVI